MKRSHDDYGFTVAGPPRPDQTRPTRDRAMLALTLRMPVGGAWSNPSLIAELAEQAEAAGFGAIGFTDHPAPPRSWRESQAGHASHDPFVALAYCAAYTTTIRLMTYLAVLPYRAPLVSRKAAVTVDNLSGGRLTMVVGAGYLEGEFGALGIDFAQRNVQFEGALEALTRPLDETDSVVLDPPAVQQPHVPVWVGGSSRQSMRRAARHASGWSPLVVNASAARAARTATIATLTDLEARIRDYHRLLRDHERDPLAHAVQVQRGDTLREMLASPNIAQQEFSELTRIGVTNLVVQPSASEEPAEVLKQVSASGRFVGP